jgi:hypothetical protein
MKTRMTLWARWRQPCAYLFLLGSVQLVNLKAVVLLGLDQTLRLRDLQSGADGRENESA